MSWVIVRGLPRLHGNSSNLMTTRGPLASLDSRLKLSTTGRMESSDKPDRSVGSPYNERDYSEKTTTHFGYQTVTEGQKVDKVLGVFNSVADKYDLMNDAMSLGVHRLWKDHFVSTLNPHRAMRLLDVAGGTGDIAFRVLDRLGQVHGQTKEAEDEDAFGHITCCDINESMLRVGQQRAEQLGPKLSAHLTWKQGDAMNLPFEDNSFHAYTIAFGIRNVVKVDKALREAHRVLKPGGRFMCLEFSHVENAALGTIYDNYSYQVIPPMGKVLAGDWDSYQYLVESIRKFPKQEDFKDMIRDAGFKAVTYENLTFGVVAIHSGFKL